MEDQTGLEYYHRQTQSEPETRKGGNDRDVLPLKAAQHDSIWGFRSELQTNPMTFHLGLLWAATFTPRRGCDGLGQNKIVRVGKNSGPVLSRLTTTVHEIVAQRGRPYFPAPLPDCLTFHSADACN